MKTYIGTKVIAALPMTRQAYNDLRGWALPANENGADEGFLVEYRDGGPANHPDFKGYISWSPADVFAKSYRPTVGLPFSLALEALLLGEKVARAGWNGAGQFVSKSGPIDGQLVASEHFWSRHNAEFAHDMGGQAKVLPSLSLKNAQNEIVMGWVPSTGDLFASDWEILS